MNARSRLWLKAVVIAGFVAVAGSSTTAQSSAKVVCHTSKSEGAAVDVEARCSAFEHFSSEDATPDERVARNLNVKEGEFARSIALVVGIGKYDNASYDLPAAEKDVERLSNFLIFDQQFDEVIVLSDKAATIDNIRYFLRTYATERAAFYQGKVRFLFAYSGHGVPIQTVGDVATSAGLKPSVGLALSNAVDDHDLTNIYGLDELRPLFTDLSKNVYQFLALINACYGGDVFGLAYAGGDINDMASRSSYGITAGPSDDTVISLGSGHGSLFFDTIIDGIETGDADPEARKVTLGLASQPKKYAGLVRLGPLDSYISTQIDKIVDGGLVSAQQASGNSHHWSGPIVPDGVRSLGGFFFFQHAPVFETSVGPPWSRYDAAVRTEEFYGPSLNQITPPQTPHDGFGVLRAQSGEKRGVDVSHLNGKIDWRMVAHAGIQFAYIKATQSTQFRDSRFVANWAGAKAVGLARGAYHTFSFCQPPEEQVAIIRRVVPPDRDALPFALDAELFPGQSSGTIAYLKAEGACADQLGAAGIRQNILNMMDALRDAYGKEPVLYGNDYLLDKIMGPDFTATRTIWRVAYGVKRAPRPPWALWQFTQNETVNGIKGPVDISVLAEAPDKTNQTDGQLR